MTKKLITPASQSSVRMIFCNKQSGITAITDFHFYEATLNCPYGQFYLNNVCTVCSLQYLNCLACDDISCSLCDNGYTLEMNGICVQCSYSNCISCSSVQCLTCSTGYFTKSGLCSACNS